ncbi:MAG: hypothetical protein SAK29_30815 [Scytonema sp. PMC 1069.18]|nr:hypothetical protein [Scytonema sp. PMC 1069.18]MEC4882201.1 hypothetical protein [Scytonema sp. PMC 1070.18]
MTSVSKNSSVEIKEFPIRLEKEGQITVPQVVQQYLNVTEGDMLTLLQIGETVLLTSKKPQVPQLADQITVLREDESVTLDDLLEGIETEREAIWLEH